MSEYTETVEEEKVEKPAAPRGRPRKVSKAVEPKGVEDISVDELSDYEDAIGATEALVDDLPEGCNTAICDYVWIHENESQRDMRHMSLISANVIGAVTPGNHRAIPDRSWNLSKSKSRFQRMDAVLFFAKKGDIRRDELKRQEGLLKSFEAAYGEEALGDGVTSVSSADRPDED